MRALVLLFAATTALAQPPRQTQFVTTEDFRGVSAVSAQIAWASGTRGTYLRTTDGHTWIPGQVPNAANLDFRGVVAFSADEAFLLSSGSGDRSRIYHTSDAGQHWQLQVTATNSKSFFDAMAFWDRTHGIVLGDPIADAHGQLKFQLLITDDGQTWTPIDPSQLPPAIDGEGAFAASNSCLAILPSMQTSTQLSPHMWKSGGSAPGQPQEKEGTLATGVPDPNVWFATGGKAARVFYSPDRGRTWKVFNTPIAHGPDSAGIFSITFRDPNHGIVAGGDYKHPNREGPNLAFTNDGGKTWTLSKIYPQSYYSAVAYDRRSLEGLSFRPEHSLAESEARRSGGTCCPPESSTTAASRLDDNQAQVRLFITAPDFIYDFRPPRDPTRISPPKKSGVHFNAVSPYPAGGALFVGPKGSVATIP